MAINRITPEKAKELLDSETGYVYLDVRTVQEFDAGHVPGAKNIPVLEPDPGGRMQFNPRFVELVEANFGKDAKVITGCQMGGRSLKAAELLLAAGFSNVVDMRGGFGGEPTCRDASISRAGRREVFRHRGKARLTTDTRISPKRKEIVAMMKGAVHNVLEAVGSTPIVKLNNVGSHLAADIYVKLEYLNPGGSMKDRVAINIIRDYERRGLLKPGGTIVEATSGNTGMGLALVAAIRGYKCIFVMPDKMSEEKIKSLQAFGARVVICPTAVDPRILAATTVFHVGWPRRPPARCSQINTITPLIRALTTCQPVPRSGHRPAERSMFFAPAWELVEPFPAVPGISRRENRR